MIDMLEYYNVVKKLDIDIIYSGPLWMDGIEGIGGTLKQRMVFDELPMSASQSVFSVFVEQMNNMLMYSDQQQEYNAKESKRQSTAKGVFILGVKEGAYFIQSGNAVKNSKIDLIKEKIDFVNSLDKAGLRKYYKEQIKSENTNPDSKGAGLGIIEIARRSSSKIEYSFVPLEEGMSFFSMYVTIAQGRG